MKMCVLPPEDDKVETAGSIVCREKREMSSATMIDVKKPRGSSFDGKRPRGPSMTDNKQNEESSYQEEKRTNSDDESESKVCSDARDQSMDVTGATTKGLDTLAAMASEAQLMSREEMNAEKNEGLVVPAISKSQSKSPSDSDDKARNNADNSNDAAPSDNKHSNGKKTQTPSRQHPSDMHSPPFDRYGAPPPHYMHAPPPPPVGFIPPPNPYYTYGHYMPSPQRVPSSPYYNGHYYPTTHPHGPNAYESRHPAYPSHLYDARNSIRFAAASVLSSPGEEMQNRVSVPPVHKNKPSNEGLPLKKRKFQEDTGDVRESKAGVEVDKNEDDKEKSLDKIETAEKKEPEGKEEKLLIVDSERPKKIARESSEAVVTPSPRSIESRSANSSSASIGTAIVASKESNDKKSKEPNDKDPSKKTTEIQSPSPPAVHPNLPHGPRYRPQHPSYHPRGGPHYPSPLRAAQMKRRDQGLISPPHYPYHGYHYPPHYYPPPHHPHHEHAPYWHRHNPHPYGPHRPTHVGSGASMPNVKPIEVVSSANNNMDGIERNVLPKRKPSPSNKEDVCVSRDPNPPDAAVFDSAAVGDSNGRRCVHIYGSMLVHFVGKRGPAESDTASLPSFYKLVNYPEFLPQKFNHYECNTLSDDEAKQKATPTTKNCVMCGTCCFFVGTNASKNKVEKEAAAVSSPYIIPRQNKGLCTGCDVKIWLVRDLNLTIKWCKGCKNFRAWSAFGEKSRATKCSKCRDRQKEKYAAQKEALKKKRESDKDKDRGSDSEESGIREGKASDDEMDAASGLCNMMNGCV